ncbi:MAG: hypothetical protein H6813_05150 [Phycisphaeraceae bacterium]|nr:hypothetical protein [Phycisphaeraceae bacterium]MCB9847771.1 hypothetical protein [Phycisphaeraceae bacterium]
MRNLLNRSVFVALLLGAGVLTNPAAEAQLQRDRNGMPPVPEGGPGRVGARAERLRLSLPVDPVVVIVPDTDAYIDAIARWSPEHRYPVLIDDGTPGSRDNIARFVKAFGPEKTLLWPGARNHEGDLRDRIESANRSAWGADSPESLRDAWTAFGTQPPGVVVASETDPAWPGALALAAGRGQLLFWVGGDRGVVTRAATMENFKSLDEQIESQFQHCGYTWAQIGDDIDSITLCLSDAPDKVWTTPGKEEALAITDLIGRFDDGRIYAWAGLVQGTNAESAYRAMSALFLQPQSFWLFNGYGEDPPYDGYTVYPVETALRKLGYRVDSFNPPRNSIDDWRAATRAPLDAGAIHVNSSGNRRWFDLHPGRAQTSDIPFLEAPAVVTFIHSFSAKQLSDRDSIARRWLDNGAYAYVGAVDEPFLQGFTPPVYLMQGMFTPVPLGVMIRPNSEKPWKINTYGDPLITFGPKAKRTSRIPTLPGAQDLTESANKALKEGDYTAGIRGYVMLGRTGDAAQLGKAIILQDPASLTPELADTLLRVFYATSRPDLCSRCYLEMDAKARRDTAVIDLLWKALGKELLTTRSEEILDAMTENVRDATFLDDITAISNAMRRLRGDPATLAYLTRLERAETNEDRRRFLRSVIGRIDTRRE